MTLDPSFGGARAVVKSIRDRTSALTNPNVATGPGTPAISAPRVVLRATLARFPAEIAAADAEIAAAQARAAELRAAQKKAERELEIIADLDGDGDGKLSAEEMVSTAAKTETATAFTALLQVRIQ